MLTSNSNYSERQEVEQLGTHSLGPGTGTMSLLLLGQHSPGGLLEIERDGDVAFSGWEMARSQCGGACGRKGDIIVMINAIYHMLIRNNVYEVPTHGIHSVKDN